MRRLLTAFLATLLLLVVAPAASAQTTTAGLDAAASALRRDRVYVDPAAERAGQVSAPRLRERVGQGDGSVFVAVLPASTTAEAGGTVQQVLTALMGKVGLRGTYAVLVGDSFLATSNAIPPGQAASLANAAIQAHRSDGPGAVLESFVDRVNDAEGGSSASGDSTGGASDGRGSGGGSGGGTVLLLLLLGGAAFFLWSRSRRARERKVDQKEFEADRQMLQAELSVLGSDVMELEPHVTMHPSARPDYDAGVTRYQSAQAAMEYADDQVDLVRVERVIEEGRYAMARARARIDGREPPPPPEKLTKPGRHDEPALDLDERGEPVYVGYGGGWYGGGGWFGGGGGMLTGLMLGSMLGGGWGGWGWGGGWGGQGDGGDSGGGGWGGGDFGGGDFGGGDFGGGDFGGGDF